METSLVKARLIFDVFADGFIKLLGTHFSNIRALYESSSIRGERYFNFLGWKFFFYSSAVTKYVPSLTPSFQTWD